MAFVVHFHPNGERYLLETTDLSVTDRTRVIEGVRAELGADADQFLRGFPLVPEDPARPHRFWYDFWLAVMGDEGDEGVEVVRFRFFCDGAGHPYGVTEVLYVDRIPG